MVTSGAVASNVGSVDSVANGVLITVVRVIEIPLEKMPR
jgi:hypothetical protein